MTDILTLSEIKAIENEANDSGMSYLRMMENAGVACAKAIRQEFDESLKRKVLVACGKGKNGGDGFVIARKLYENGYDVTVLLCLGFPKAEDAVEMFSRLDNLNIPVIEYLTESERAKERIEKSDIIVDCIFGTGFLGEADEFLAELFSLINASKAYTVSVDLPSGFYTDSSCLCPDTVMPDMTLSVIGLKRSLVYPPSALRAGKVKCVGIGISERILCKYGSEYTLTAADIKKRFPVRPEDSNKGDFGKAFLIAGSYEMPGAALLASKACVNSGAGLVRLAFPDKAYAAVTADCPEKVLLPLPSNERGQAAASGINELYCCLEKCSAVLVGCGMGQGNDTRSITEFVLDHSEVPVVLDADALNSLKGRADYIKKAKAPVIITPHPGEAARLLGKEVSEIEKDRIASAKELHALTGATVLLKGFRTVVTDDGELFYINTVGNSALATAGSGDVLAGLLASLLCQGFSPLDAAVCAAYLHGISGESVSAKLSKSGACASDFANELKYILKRFEK